MIGGVYYIKNELNNKMYIGSTFNFEKREKEHENALIKDYHKNDKLQNAWNKYGEENFLFGIIEEYSLPEEFSRKEKNKIVRSREQYYLDTILKARIDDSYFREMGYNIAKIATGGSDGIKITGGNSPLHRKITVFDLEMNFIEEISGLRAAERKYKTTSIWDCCQGRTKTCNGYVFKYSNPLEAKYAAPLKEYYGKTDYFYKHKVYQYDLIGNFIKEWASCEEIAKALGIKRKYFHRIFRLKETNITSGFIFTFEKIEDSEMCKFLNHKRVGLYSKDMELLGIYKSSSAAQNCVENISQSTVLLKCKNGTLYNNLYYFKFID